MYSGIEEVVWKCCTVFWMTTLLMITGLVNPALYGAECDPITVHYNERVPYQQTTGSGVVGLTAEPVTWAFNKASLKFVWKKMSSKRQMKLLQDNQGCDCMVGWFKLPERLLFAKYSHAIYQDQPPMAIARADNEMLYNDMSVVDVLSNRSLKLLLKDGYSYGAFLDKKIAQYHPSVVKTTGENVNMLKMIHRKHADYFFIAPEESTSLIKLSGLPIEDFKSLTFLGMPAGEKRYLLCSRRVDDAIMDKLNRAIDAYMNKDH
jgi:polar amino acid transport system substrate-binding protein